MRILGDPYFLPAGASFGPLLAAHFQWRNLYFVR
jgi:hypothetical protein